MPKRGLGKPAGGSAVRPTLSTPASGTAAGGKAISVRVSEELHNRYLNAVDALAGPPERLTYVSLGRTAIEREIERLEKKHHGGKPFPQRPK